MKILPDFVRRSFIGIGREVFARKAIARRESLPLVDADVSLHMVVGHDMLLMGMLALRSFEFHTRFRWAPIIHDDGSFSDEDERTLLRNFPDARLIRRATADAEVPEALGDFPSCRLNRMKHNWFLKVFDTRHYAPHDRYIVLDSDIVFFRRPAAILQWINDSSDTMWVMEDEHEKYSHPRGELESELGLKMLQRANSGLDLVPKEAASLALAEDFLGRCAATAGNYAFLEQTIFGIFASAWGRGGLLPPEKYEISWNALRQRGSVCRHYIGPAKNDALYVEGATTFWLQSCVTGILRLAR